MKKNLNLLVEVSMILLAFVCATSNIAAAAPLGSMTWDEINRTAATQEVVFTCWYSEELFTKICRDFTEKTGIKATLVVSDSSAVANKLIAEKGMDKASIDVIVVGGQHVKLTIDAGIWQEGILNMMPSKDAYDPMLSKVQEGVPNPGSLVPVYRNQTGLLYNPEMVSDPPQTFADLEQFIEENPNKFGFCDPSKGGSGQSFIHSVIKEKTGGLEQYMGDTEADPEKVAKWDAVWQWFLDRKDKAVITTSNYDSLMRLNQGELSLIVAWDDDANVYMQKGELFKDAALYIPEFGMAGGGDTLGIPANSANKEAALVFIDYITGIEAQRTLDKEGGLYPARTDIEVLNTLINKDDMRNSVAWIPAQYKQLFIRDFVEKVLMQ